MNPKLVVCFLNQTNGSPVLPQVWEDFFRHGRGRAVPLIHAKLSPCREWEKHCIADTVPTEWGHVSLVEATVKLFDEAFDRFPTATRFALCSESCVPLRPAREIVDIFDSFGDLPTFHTPEIFTDEVRRLRAQEGDVNFRSSFRLHSQWITMSRVAWQEMRHLLTLNLRAFGTFTAPDEFAFATTARLLDMPYLSHETTLALRSPGQRHPSVLDEIGRGFLRSPRSEGTVFARKVHEWTRFGLSLR